MSATRHWIALDDAVSRLLPKPGVRHARERFARRAAALTDIYVARILRTIAEPAADGTDLTHQLRELQLTHRALTGALTRAWARDGGPGTQDKGPRPEDPGAQRTAFRSGR